MLGLAQVWRDVVWEAGENEVNDVVSGAVDISWGTISIVEVTNMHD